MNPRTLARITVALLSLSALMPVVVTAIVASTLLYPPPLDELPDPRPPGGSQLSRVYDVNGREIAIFREFDQRVPLEAGAVPEHLKQAVISMEDQSFYANSGVDFRGALRALIANVRGQEITQGGSTITQQYVKNAYVGTERTLERKLKEAVLARQLDRLVDKDEILFKYLDAVYLGGDAIGVGAASMSYFRKPVSELTLSESALLAGLIPAPSDFEPRGSPEEAEERRVLVLDTMLDQGHITEAEHEEAVDQRLWLAADGPAPRGSTLVYPTAKGPTEYPYFVDYVRRYLESQYGQAVYAGGLEIHTTLDPRLQETAERTVSEALAGTQPPIEMALVSVEPGSGFVRAMVGGRDFNATAGQVNLALGKCHQAPEEVRDGVDVAASCWSDDAISVEGGGSGRQPGSSWKPFVLAAALEQGMSDSTVYSAPSTYRIPNCVGDENCTINNYEGSAGGSASLRTATERSYNTVYAQVIQDVGVPEVGAMAKKLGISSAWVASPERHNLEYALGSQEVSPLDMASAFGVFAASGERFPATPVLWVSDVNGDIVEDNRQRQPERVLPASVAYTVTDILKGVISGGTGTAADIGRPAAGKTGTAQEWRDAWFVGYTPTLSTAVWIGDKTKPTSLFNIKGVSRVTGGSIPAETWKVFMTQALEGVPPTDFEQPPPPPPPPAPPPTVFVPPPIPAPPSTVATTTTLPSFSPPTTRPRPTTTMIVPRNSGGGGRRTTTTRAAQATTTTTTTDDGGGGGDTTSTIKPRNS